MPSDDRTELLNLIYRFAAHFDAGEFEAAMALFAPGRFLLSHGEVSTDEMLAMWRTIIVLHDGAPRTRHLVTNSQCDIAGDNAHVQSYYTVMQATDKLPLQAIIAGRYDDRFVRVNGVWQFHSRDYTLMDMVGDLSQHLTQAAIEQMVERHET